MTRAAGGGGQAGDRRHGGVSPLPRATAVSKPGPPFSLLTLAAVLLAVAGAHPAAFMLTAAPRRPPSRGEGAFPAPVVIHGTRRTARGLGFSSSSFFFFFLPSFLPSHPPLSSGSPSSHLLPGRETGHNRRSPTFVSSRRLLPAPRTAGPRGGREEAESPAPAPAPAFKDAAPGLRVASAGIGVWCPSPVGGERLGPSDTRFNFLVGPE